jgi:hypothetical protein
MKFNELPTWAKGVVAVVGLAAIVGAGYGIWRTIKKAIEASKEGKDDKEFKEETSQELQVLQQQGITPTLSDSAALSLAQDIQVSLDGGELSGTEERIYKAVLQAVNNQADWLKLQNVYGVRETDNFGIGTGSSKQDLKGILMSDLDGFDWSFTLYSTLLRKGLEAKGITF